MNHTLSKFTYDLNDNGAYVILEGENKIATVSDWITNDKEMAALFCASPEMLEALIASLPYVEMAEHDEVYIKGAVSKMVKQIKAAISRAEGGTK